MSRDIKNEFALKVESKELPKVEDSASTQPSPPPFGPSLPISQITGDQRPVIASPAAPKEVTAKTKNKPKEQKTSEPTLEATLLGKFLGVAEEVRNSFFAKMTKKFQLRDADQKAYAPEATIICSELLALFNKKINTCKVPDVYLASVFDTLFDDKSKKNKGQSSNDKLDAWLTQKKRCLKYKYDPLNQKLLVLTNRTMTKLVN